VILDDQEAGAFQTFEDCLEKKWPANAFFESVSEVRPPQAPCCAACGSILRTDSLVVGYEEDFADGLPSWLNKRDQVADTEGERDSSAEIQPVPLGRL